MSEPTDGMAVRHRRLREILEYVMHEGPGVSTEAIIGRLYARHGGRLVTLRGYIAELHQLGFLRSEKDGWHTTAKAKEFFVH